MANSKVSAAAELRQKSPSELNEQLVELRKEELKLRMERGAGQLNDFARFKSIRKQVARIKTVLNESA